MAMAIRNKSNSGFNRLLLLAECVTLLLGLLSIVLASQSGASLSLVFLPFGYLLALLVLGNDNVVRLSPGIAALNIVLFSRFVLMPLAMCLTGKTSVYILDSSNLQYGVPLMLYELVGIVVVLKCTAKKQREVSRESSSLVSKNLYYGGLVAFCAAALLVVLALKYRYLISGFSLISEGTVAGYSEDDLASGLVVALWDSLLGWIYVWLLLVTKKHVKSDRLCIAVALMATFGFLLMVYVGQVSVSRWHTVIAFAAALFCLTSLFPRYRKAVVTIVVVPVVILIFTASAFKNSTYSWEGVSYSQAMGQLFDVSLFDIYLAGPSTVSDGATMYGLMSVPNPEALVIDFVQDLPFINHWVDKNLSTIYAYHLYLGRGDLIMPLIGQSMIYFGWPFAPVLSMVSVYFVRLFDRLLYKAKSLPHVFIASFAGAWFGVATILNVTITMSWVGLRIVPFYLLIMFTELFAGQNKARRKDCDSATARKAVRRAFE